jgi:hypothetical protein
MAGPRQMVSLEEIKDRLLAEIDRVVEHYAPPAAGAYRRGHDYFTLNPGRADRSVGSFVVHLGGPKAGRWADYATDPKGGDLIDLIALSRGCNLKSAVTEARAFLGLDSETPELRRQREEAAARAKVRRAEAEREAAKHLERKRKAAAALWLSGEPKIEGTPVDLYLHGRGIDIAALGHRPGAIRYHAACRYYWTEEWVDPATGEVTQRRMQTTCPAMLCAIVKGSQIIDCHRTYLALGPAGQWVKNKALPLLPKGKWVATDYTGGAVRLSGGLGPRGGRLRLAEAPPGSRVFITEGIENGLSLMALRALAGQEPAFVVAAGMVANLGSVELPDTVAEVVLCADNDTGEQARAQVEKAIAAHAARGRVVRVWRSEIPGEDLNDALLRVLAGGDRREGAA